MQREREGGREGRGGKREIEGDLVILKERSKE